MQKRFFWGPLLAGLVFLAAAGAIGAWAYDAGVAHGVAEASRQVAVPVEGATRVYVWPGPGPWGHGFGHFPIFPLVALFLVFWLAAGAARRMAWRHHAYGSRCGRAYDGVPPMFEEWHRRAHERQGAAPPPPETTA
jgi:hypothetical protein